MNRILILIMILVTPIKGVCQDYSIKWYTSQDKQLPQNTVKSIAKDKYNFIWLGTENGLVRFDGKQFITYNINSQSIENRTLIIEGNKEKDTLYTFYNSPKNYAIINKRNPIICFGCGSFSSIDNKSLHDQTAMRLIHLDDDVSRKIKQNFDLNNDERFTIQNDTIRYYVNNTHLVHSYRLKQSIQNNFFVSDNNLYYLVNEKKILKFDKKGLIQTIKTGLDFNNKKYTIIQNYVNKQFFIIFNDSIYLFNAKNFSSSFTPIFKNDIVINKFALSLYYDSTINTLYFGTASNGLGIVRFNLMNVLKSDTNSIEINYAITKFQRNEIFTGRKAIYSNDRFIKKLDTIKPKLISRGVLISDYNKIVLLDDKGICEYDPENKYSKRYIYHEDREITIMNKGLKQRIWFTFGALNPINKETFGYVKYTKSGYSKPVFFSTKIRVNSILEIEPNKLLLASNEGLFFFNTTTKTNKLLYKGINIRTINKTKGDFYWLTTYGQGLYLFYKNKIVKLPSDNPSLLTPHCVLEDDNGFYWVSTNNGLFQFKKSNVLKFLINNITPIYFYGYDKNDGILNNEFNGACDPAGIKMNSGKLYFPSMDGIVYFDSNSIKPILPNKEIYIDRAVVDTKEYLLVKDTLKLSKKFENLLLHIDVPNYGNSNNLKLEYAISESLYWILLPENRTITINNLNSGYNIIRVRTLNNFEGNYNYKNVVVYVAPEFWETTWFKSILIAIAVLIIYLIVKVRTVYFEKENKKLLERVNERTSNLNEAKDELLFQVRNQKKLIQSITHDIKSPLRYLTNGSQYMFVTAKDPDISEASKSIYESSFQLYNYIDNLLNYSKIFMFREENKSEKFSIHDLFDEKVLLFKNIAQINDTEIINKSESNAWLLSNKTFLNIIIHNLIDNAIKHTKKGQIVLNCTVKNNTMIISVTDTGNGMTASKLTEIRTNYLAEERGVGYTIIRELVAILKAELVIESEIDKGTTVCVIFENS